MSKWMTTENFNDDMGGDTIIILQTEWHLNHWMTPSFILLQISTEVVS